MSICKGLATLLSLSKVELRYYGLVAAKSRERGCDIRALFGNIVLREMIELSVYVHIKALTLLNTAHGYCELFVKP